MEARPKAPEPSIRDLFLEALDLPSSARRSFLQNACRGNANLQKHALELLDEHESLGSFMDGPACEANIGFSEKPGDVIGRYKLIEQIGEGGVGTVYRAQQLHPVRREVAFKIVKLGMDTKNVIARFGAEKQAVAMMDHPSIAKVYDANATETGRPYFAMELVRGMRITEYCDEHSLSTEARLRLFVQVCQAIQHAHQKGIIHRDIKPSNVLVTETDSGAIPKIIDFGIAKATEQRLSDLTVLTEFRSLIGTPAYMSPEQMEMTGSDVDTRSDIYSLGVLLYEMLTGQTPFAPSLMRSGIDEFRRVVRDNEPQSPSNRVGAMPASDLTTTASRRKTDNRTFVKLLRGELDWIVMKCLEKERTRRYETANDLAADVLHFLAAEPIMARPPSAAYRAQKFVRRHRIALSAAAAVITALLVAFGISLREASRARRAEQDAVAARLNAERESQRASKNEARALINEYVADMTLAQQALNAGNFGRASSLLSKHLPIVGQKDLRGFEWGYLKHVSQGDPHHRLIEQGEQIRAVAFSPDGRFLAVGAREKATVFSAANFSAMASSTGGLLSIAFSSDNKSLYIADQSSVRTLDFTSNQTRRLSGDLRGPIDISKDGLLIAGVARDSVRVFQIDPWTPKHTFYRSSGPLSFAPDGDTMIAGGRDGLTLWPLDPEFEPMKLRGRYSSGPFHQFAKILAYSPDGKKIFVAQDRIILAIDAASGIEIGTIPKDGEAVHSSTISSLAVSSDGKIATGAWDHSIQLWDSDTFSHVGSLEGHLNEVWSLAFSPDGNVLLSGAKDGGAFLWPLSVKKETDFIAGNWHPVSFSADEKKLLLTNERSEIAIVATQTGLIEKKYGPVRDRGPSTRRVSGSTDLRLIARVADGAIEIINSENDQITRLPHNGQPVSSVVLAPDGESMVTGTWGRSISYKDIEEGINYTLPTDADRAYFTSDGKRVLVLSRSVVAYVWNCKQRRIEKTLTLDAPIGYGCAISPDNKLIAAGEVPNVGNSIMLIDFESGKTVSIFPGHKQGIGSLAFSADGQTLASASSDGLKFWNLTTGQQILTFSGQEANSPVFSVGGAYMAFYRREGEENGVRLLRTSFPLAANRKD